MQTLVGEDISSQLMPPWDSFDFLECQVVNISHDWDSPEVDVAWLVLGFEELSKHLIGLKNAPDYFPLNKLGFAINKNFSNNYGIK